MSETTVLLLQVTVARPALVGYLDATPFSAARWPDWTPLIASEGSRSRWHDDQAGFTAAVDAGMAGTNRALASALLAEAIEQKIGYDPASRRFTLSALLEWQSAVALGPFLVFARGLANAMRGEEEGLASVRIGDVDLMARDADTVALVSIGADSHSSLLDRQREPGRYADYGQRSNRLFLAVLDEMAGGKSAQPAPNVLVTSAMLVEAIEHATAPTDVAKHGADRWRTDLAAIR